MHAKKASGALGGRGARMPVALKCGVAACFCRFGRPEIAFFDCASPVICLGSYPAVRTSRMATRVEFRHGGRPLFSPQERKRMNIVVCIKQILDTTDVRFDAATGYLKREGQPTTINSLDEYAVEEALRLKEAHGGTVTVLSMGPSQAVDTLKHAVAMGADEAVHLCDAAFAGADTLATTYALSRAIAAMEGVDLIICGAESVDGNTAYVPSALATALKAPFVAFVTKIEEIGGGKMVVQRLMEQGYDRIESPTPAVISVVKGINEPRISSLKGKMRAKKYQPAVKTAADLAGAEAAKLGAAGSTSKVLRTYAPEARPAGVMLTGEPAEIADKLYAALTK